jgi:NADH-quinone oxidoreductase subunit J
VFIFSYAAGNLDLPVSLRELLLAAAVIVLGATGTYLLLPHSHGWAKPKRAHALGGLLLAVSLLLFALFFTPPGPFLASLFFYGFSLTSVAAGVLTITSRNPIYSALWFAAVVLATSGLFLLSGAQFLAAGTVIVYAGAIIVTFLFVIMLAQSQGQAMYDRMARAPGRATFCCFLLLWALVYALLVAKTPVDKLQPAEGSLGNRLLPLNNIAKYYRFPMTSDTRMVLDRANRATAQLPTEPKPGEPPATHVAGLGGTLYTDHLVSAELAGVLLFVALVGALLIASPKPPIRPGAGRSLERP